MAGGWAQSALCEIEYQMAEACGAGGRDVMLQQLGAGVWDAREGVDGHMHSLSRSEGENRGTQRLRQD